MRYAIGTKVLENDGTISDGILGYSRYGCSCILVSANIENNKYFTPIFEDVNEAKDFVKYMCSAYRDEFHKRAKRYNLDISQFRFFLVKVDSIKFKRKLGKIVENKKY